MDEAVGNEGNSEEEEETKFRNVIRNIDVAKLVAVLGQTLRKKKKFKELTLFNSKYEVKGFQYVILKKERPKVAFLSGQDRKLFYEKRGTSRLACDQLDFSQKSQKSGSYREGEYNAAYPYTKPKIFSKAGYGSLANRGPRIKLEPLPYSPGPQAYHIKAPSKGRSKCLAPFNSNSARESKLSESNNNPGIGSYHITYIEKSHSIRMEHSFGGRVKLKQIVNVECRPTNENFCKDCGHKINGDYWRKNEDTVLCDSCYRIQYYKKSYVRRQFDEFKKTRDCSFMHQHEGTTATYPLMTKKEFWSQCVNENYFSTYTDTRNVKKVEPATDKRKSRTEYTKTDASRTEQLSHSFPFLKHLNDKPITDPLKKRFLLKQELAAFYEPISLVPDTNQLMHEWSLITYESARSMNKTDSDLTGITYEESEGDSMKSEEAEVRLSEEVRHTERSDKYAEETRTPLNEPTQLTASLIDMIGVMNNTSQDLKVEMDSKPEMSTITQLEVEDKPVEDEKEEAEKGETEIGETEIGETEKEVVERRETGKGETGKGETGKGETGKRESEEGEEEEGHDHYEEDNKIGDEEEIEELILTQDPNIPPLPNILEVSDTIGVDPEIASLLCENRSKSPDSFTASHKSVHHLDLNKFSTQTIKII